MVEEKEFNIPRIEASCYCRRMGEFNLWDIANKKKAQRIRLCGDLSFEEIGSVVANPLNYSKFYGSSKKLSVDEIFGEILQMYLQEIVRIRFVGENHLETINGCCSNFSNWQDLRKVKTEFVWLGHSPSPRFDYDKKENTVRVWLDDKYVYKNRKEQSILFTWNLFKENLDRFNQDLKDFMVLLEAWAENVCPKYSKQLVEQFENNLCVEKFERFYK